MDIPHEKRFHFRDGSSVGSLEELARKLASISYVEFYHHVNPDKNDFANWIRHVLQQEPLAVELERVTSIVETIEIINDHLHPRPLTQPRTDLQSSVEKEVFGEKYPGVEEVPTTTPAHTTVAPQGEVADFTIIEESLEGEPVSETGPVAESAPARSLAPKIDEHATTADSARMIVKDFIFGFLLGLLIGAILGRMLP